MTSFFLGLYNLVLEGTRSVADYIYWQTYEYPVLSFIIFCTIFLILCAKGLKKVYRRSKQGAAYKMAQRKAYLERLYADMVGNGLSDLLLNGKISDQEYRRGFKEFGVKHRIMDLLPRKTHPDAIRSRVKKNIASTKLVDQYGNPIQPSIPGPKPAEVTVPTSPSKNPRKWVLVGKKLRKAA